MTQTSRTGCGVPFPEYANLTAGSGYVTPPEPDLAMQLFELTIVGSGVVAVTWCDERHIGTHDVPATGTGTLIGGVFDSTLTYGAYSVHIQGTVAAGAFTGTVTTTVTGVTEVHAITVTHSTSTLTFPVNCKYYSTVTGNDSNDGLSLKTSKLTLPIPSDSGHYVIERRSRITTPFGYNFSGFHVYGRGCGWRPVFDQFATGHTWADAGSGAWTTTVHGTIMIDAVALGMATVIVDGNLLKFVENLTAVRTTPGSFAVVGRFVVGGSDVTLYMRPKTATNPNTDGHIYEVCVGESGIHGLGTCTFDSLCGRGSTTTGVFTTNSGHDALEKVRVRNCDAHLSIKHNFSIYGGSYEDCVSWRAQSTEWNQGNTHFENCRFGNDTVPSDFQCVNCAAIGNPEGICYQESALLLEVQNGTVPMGPTTIDKLYVAYLNGSVVAQTKGVPVCEINDLLVERMLDPNSPVFSGGTWPSVNRARVYSLDTYAPGPLLSGTHTIQLVLRDCLFVGNAPPSASGKGYIYLANTAYADQPTILDAQRCTFVRTGSPDPNTPFLEIEHTHSYGQFTLAHNVVAGFGFYVETSGAGALPLRIGNDYNSIGSLINGYYGVSHIDSTYPNITPTGDWPPAGGTWEAADAHSVAAAVTFSGTTGRYPAYTKTSAGPGGYMTTFIAPEEYLGVQFLQALEAAGQYPV
jgi:hypothetical protein